MKRKFLFNLDENDIEEAKRNFCRGQYLHASNTAFIAALLMMAKTRQCGQNKTMWPKLDNGGKNERAGRCKKMVGKFGQRTSKAIFTLRYRPFCK